MTVNKKIDGTTAIVGVEGRLDTMTAGQLDTEVKQVLSGDVSELVFDFAQLEYISSAGLRVLLSSQKAMNAKKGSMVIRNANELILDVFEVTGFIDILTVEK